MDQVQIQAVLGLASGAVGLTGQAAATAESIKFVFAGGVKRDSAETNQLLNTLAGQLTSANVMNVQLSSALKEIASQVEADNRFERQISRYRLLPTSLGDMVFVLRDEHANGDPIHSTCPV